MNFATAYEQTTGNGWLTVTEARLLWDAARMTVGPILEVGCYEGRSTCILGQLKRPVYAVDPFDNFHSSRTGDEICAAFLENIRTRSLGNVQLFRQKIEEWKHRPIGFAYLDGDHTYQGTKAQLTVAMFNGAMAVCVHDYASSGGGREVKRAVDEREDLTVVTVEGTMAYCRRVN